MPVSYTVFRDNVYLPFAKAGIVCILFSYFAYLVYNIVTPAYFIQAFFTNPSFFIALKFLAVYLVFAALAILVLAAAIYAYIEVGRYKQQLAYLTEDRALLEIRVPENTEETLASMEALFEMISYGFGESLWFPVWWRGTMRPVHSFEIISRGGVVFFLLNIRANLSEAVSSAIWAFYPKAQITEASEYTHSFEYDPDTYSFFAFEWRFAKNNALPIKTYVEFQLDKFPAPGQMSGSPTVQPSRPLVDPLASLYDVLGSMKGKEQAWIQYVFRTQRYKRAVKKANDGETEAAEDPLDPGFWKKQNLKEEIYEALVELEKKIRKSREPGAEPFPLSASDKRLQDAGPRLMEKQALEVGIRVIYAAPKEEFRPARIGGLTTAYKLTNTAENSLNPHGTVFTSVSAVPEWEPPRKDKEAENALLLQLYRDRLFWLAPALYMHQASDESQWKKTVNEPSKKRPSLVMTTETLATVCHFPTKYIKTAGVQRSLAAAVEPPENLPV